MTKGLKTALAMYYCLPAMLNSKRENTFSYDRTKYTGDKELEDILKEKAKQRRKNKRRRR